MLVNILLMFLIVSALYEHSQSVADPFGIFHCTRVNKVKRVSKVTVMGQ